MKELESAMRAAQKSSTQVKEQLTKCRNRRDALQAEIESLRREVVSLTEQLTISTAAVTRIASEADNLSTSLTVTRGKYEAVKNAKVAKEQAIVNCSKEIKALLTEKSKYEKAAEAAAGEIKKIIAKLQTWEKDAKDAKRSMTDLIKAHQWIESEKAFFGRKESDFDFEARDVNESKTRLKTLRSDQDKLSKKINKKVMGMLETAETEYNDLNKKRQVTIISYTHT